MPPTISFYPIARGGDGFSVPYKADLWPLGREQCIFRETSPKLKHLPCKVKQAVCKNVVWVTPVGTGSFRMFDEWILMQEWWGVGGGSLFFLPLKIQRQRTRARTHLWGRSLRFFSAGCLSTGRDYGMEETRGGPCCLAKWPRLNSPKTTGDEVNLVVWSGMGRFWSQQSSSRVFNFH